MRLQNLFLLTVIVTLLVSLLIGCDGNDGPTISTDANITIKIGNLTDLTGPGANGMELVNLALEDITRYYNQNDIIQRVKFEVVHWDGQLDPSRTVPGYEWLQHKGVDFMVTCAPGVATTLKPRVEAENVVLFTQVGELEALEPPGYVFCLGSIPKNETYTFLSWIAENDWDFESGGPAKIGAAGWTEPYAASFVQAMEVYAEAHPDQFEFVGGYLTNFTFDWHNEAESLKECDYVFTPMMMHGFVEDIRNTGSQARFIGGAPHTAFLKQIGDAGAWQFIDGMLIVYTGAWWSESGEEIDFQKSLLAKYHPGKAEEIISRGSGYQAITAYLKMLEIVESAVQKSGVENFDSQALYEAAQSYSKSINGRDAYSYTSSKRFLTNELIILEANANQEDLVRNDPNWYPILIEP